MTAPSASIPNAANTDWVTSTRLRAASESSSRSTIWPAIGWFCGATIATLSAPASTRSRTASSSLRPPATSFRNARTVPPSADGGTVLAFLNEVAGGRKLLEAVRERVEAGADKVAIVAPQNQPMAGQIVDRDELSDAARSRVDVTQSVFAAFGIEAEGAVMDPDPPLALDDAIRAYEPAEVLLSCLTESRYGFMRRDLVEWATGRFDEARITHI